MVKLVSSLLARKPKDPVPHIYSYLKDTYTVPKIEKIYIIEEHKHTSSEIV